MHKNQIYELIGAQNANTYMPFQYTNALFSEDIKSFWERIARLRYVASSTKASGIIHLVLKVTHLILASTILRQQEISKAGQKELELLLCTIHNQKHLPNFGLWVIFKLLKLSRSTSGQLHCACMITLILMHTSLGNIYLSGLDAIPVEIRLTMDALHNMCLFA